MPNVIGVIPERIRRMMPEEQRRPLGKVAATMPELTAKAAIKLEREMQEQFCQYLNMRGVVFGRSRMDRRTGYTVGWPDFSFVVRGRACFVECKLPNGKLEPEQERVKDALIASGAHYRVAYSLQDCIAAYQEAEIV